MNVDYIIYVCIVLLIVCCMAWPLKKRNFFCLLGHHEWTCAANKGIKATNDQLGSWQGFKDYVKMYCKHCGKESKLNKRLN